MKVNSKNISDHNVNVQDMDEMIAEMIEEMKEELLEKMKDHDVKIIQEVRDIHVMLVIDHVTDK